MRWVALRALACALAIAGVACDECISSEGEALARCCEKTPDAPSCQASCESNGTCAGDAGNACDPGAETCDLGLGVTVGASFERSNVHTYRIARASRTRTMEISLTDGGSRSSRRSLHLTAVNDPRDTVAVLDVGSGEVGQTVVGLAAGMEYVLVINHEGDEPEASYGLRLEALDRTFELEPNDTAVKSQAVVPDVVIAGGLSTRATDGDDDYFELTTAEDTRQIVLHLQHDAQAKGAPLELAAFTRDEVQLGARLLGPDADATLAIGVAPSQRYLVRVRTDSNGAPTEYTLRAEYRQESFETEPNDTAPQATALGVDQPMLAGYSTLADTDDDVFRIDVPDGSTTLTVAIEHLDDSVPASLDSAVLNDQEAQVASQAILSGERQSVVAAVDGNRAFFARVRTTRDLGDAMYRITASFE